MTLLIDIGACCEHHTNEALEHLHKAIGEGDPSFIWDRHPSPLIEALVELFSSRGLLRLESVRKAVLKWQSGANFDSGLVPPIRPDGQMARWSADERELMRIYLKSLPPAQWTLDDHMMSIDLVVQDYLPAGELSTEAEWLAVRAGMMGKVQANMEKEPTPAQATKIAQAMPSTVAGAVQQFNIGGRFRQVLDFARVRAVENVRALSESVRHTMRSLVLQDLEQRAAGPAPGTSSLETKLLDEFGALNRDWRRIAVTEAGEALNQGLIASMPAGARMRRIEQYRGACPWCRKIDGKVMEVVDANDPDKDGETQIWPGKNNYGRSAAERKRVGGALVKRDPEEKYWIATGTQHPHCRGRWLREPDVDPADDPDFAATLRDILGKK
jgi:hypothetical protein